MSNNQVLHCDVAVVGSGLAGMAAALYAGKKGLDVVQTGMSGAVAYTTGAMDILGAVPATEANPSIEDVDSPKDSYSTFCEIFPEHPYARIDLADVHAAFEEMMEFLGEYGVRYVFSPEKNLPLVTPAGTLKNTAALPETMIQAAEALNPESKCVVIGVEGFKGFSPVQVCVNLAEMGLEWEAVKVRVPYMDGEIFPESLARSLEVPAQREAFAEALKPLLGDAEYACLPAVLGVHGADAAMRHLEELCGVKFFEIPTMPPGVPGIRLREAFETGLAECNVRAISQSRVTKVEQNEDGFTLSIKSAASATTIQAKSLLLATGRFIGGGLIAGRTGVEESLMELFVAQPEDREGWYGTALFDPKGHGIKKAGVVIDDSFRPVDGEGNVYNESLYVAGTILAGQDWTREKSGAGVALGSAYAAVKNICKKMGK
ncbi:MAG: glycerol-3-phosphate dehydrogenase subunit GlpB [Desulfovibrio sp.]